MVGALQWHHTVPTVVKNALKLREANIQFGRYGAILRNGRKPINEIRFFARIIRY